MTSSPGSDSTAGMLGGYPPRDGTVEFYGRLSAFLQPDFVVVDLGAGRGAWHEVDHCPYRRSLRMIKGKVARVIGLDVDDAVLSNPCNDENHLIDGRTLPLASASVDVVIADFVLEHLDEPAAIEAEVLRILKPGGLFCARTPHVLNYVSLASRLAPGARGGKLLQAAQPGRKPADVFETRYRCNSLRRIRQLWSADRWISHSYLYAAEPSYDFGSRLVYRLLDACHKVLPLALVGNVFVFEIKRGPSCTS